jgi:myo-inositol-1(or 4)-monophosphatase
MRKWKGGNGMTAIDFSSFIDQLATSSGDTILPFFRTALAVENK